VGVRGEPTSRMAVVEGRKNDAVDTSGLRQVVIDDTTVALRLSNGSGCRDDR
jgi:hypothetical protein